MADVPVNPQSLVTAGANVTAANPLPCKSYAQGTPNQDVAVNPVTWIVNGAIVSVSNPLPITLE